MQYYKKPGNCRAFLFKYQFMDAQVMLTESQIIGSKIKLLQKYLIDNIKTNIQQISILVYDRSHKLGYDAYCSTYISNAIKSGLITGIQNFCNELDISINHIVFLTNTKNASWDIPSKTMYLPADNIELIADSAIEECKIFCPSPHDNNYHSENHNPSAVFNCIEDGIDMSIHDIKKISILIMHEIVHASQGPGLSKSSYKATHPPIAGTPEYAVWFAKYKADPAEIDAYANQYVSQYISNYKNITHDDLNKFVTSIVSSSKYNDTNKKKFAKAVYKAFSAYFS